MGGSNVTRCSLPLSVLFLLILNVFTVTSNGAVANVVNQPFFFAIRNSTIIFP